MSSDARPTSTTPSSTRERSRVAAGSTDMGDAETIEIDTLVVGAGPQALTVLARWVCERPACVSRILVVDPAGSWMQTWDRQFDRQRIDVLRSPGVHHPDPDEMAFVRSHEHRDPPHDRRVLDRSCTAVGLLRRPATAAFHDFCVDLTRRSGLWRRTLQAQVVALEPLHAAGAPARWAAALDHGAIVHARHVVWAANPRIRNLPSGVEFGDAVVHSDDVDLSEVAAGDRIAVLGGGQTAGQLALEAARRGADVALVTRGPLRVADLDVDAAWLMKDHLKPFRSIDDPAERRRVVERARRGSMTADLVDSLRRASVRLLCEAGELSARPTDTGATVAFAGIEIPVDRVWVATGSAPDLRADPALVRLAANGAPHVDGWPVLDSDMQWLEGLSVVGALAALTLGPAAGNLGGARAAADVLASHGPVISCTATEHGPRTRCERDRAADSTSGAHR